LADPRASKSKPVSRRPKFPDNVIDLTCLRCEVYIGSNFLELVDGDTHVTIPLCHKCTEAIKAMDEISNEEAEMMLKRMVYRGMIESYEMV
jgi:hypothetical protein